MTQAIHALQLLEPLYDAVTFIMKAFHTLFKGLGLDPASGLVWTLSIVGLVIVIVGLVLVGLASKKGR